MTCDYDPTLALHCLAVPLGTTRTFCPIIRQRSIMMKPDPDCEGRTPLDTLFEFLVQAITEQGTLDEDKKKHRVQWAELRGQINALCYSIALIKNPYNPDMDPVLAEAEMEASKR